ncbi:hypothetical protein SBA4_3580012 [Candidatus Sulfopaludibacter sp. SbA4]|nr:hypothetical protein SBA4_3580012 [Candidatus Sulfopaludibacter sp. SbA4]
MRRAARWVLPAERAAPAVKQHLACIRMLFDWLVTGPVIPLAYVR